jgi:hypothetical protein
MVGKIIFIQSLLFFSLSFNLSKEKAASELLICTRKKRKTKKQQQQNIFKFQKTF